MNQEEAEKIIRKNWPPENYTRLREALVFVLARSGQIDALKEKLINETAMQKTGSLLWDSTPLNWKEAFLKDARQQLAEDEKMKSVGVTWE